MSKKEEKKAEETVVEKAAAEAEAGDPKKKVEVYYDGIYPEIILTGLGRFNRARPQREKEPAVAATRITLPEPEAKRLVASKGFKFVS